MAKTRSERAHLLIQLGGLVAKAGLKSANKAFLLGYLLAAYKIKPGSSEYNALCDAGRRAFDSSSAHEPSEESPNNETASDRN